MFANPNHAARGSLVRDCGYGYRLDLRPSERAEKDCAKKHEHRANHDNVDFQGYVHERASLIVDDDSSLSESGRVQRAFNGATQNDSVSFAITFNQSVAFNQ